MTSSNPSNSRSSSSTRKQPLRGARTNPNNKGGKRSAGAIDSGDGALSKKPRQQIKTPAGGRDGKPWAAENLETVTTATTFGVEFEFVLLFHEATLSGMKEDGSIIDVIKDHDHNKQNSLLSHEFEHSNRAFMGRSLWPSWLLRVSDVDEAILKDAVRGTSESIFGGNRIRRYVMEPLLVARQALTDAGLSNVQVIGWTDKKQTRPHCIACAGKEDVDLDHYTVSFGNYGNDILLRNMVPDYSKWTLTNDYTIVPVRRSELGGRLIERNLQGDLDSWDSYGLELVTRVMRFDQLDNSFKEIDKHLAALKQQKYVDVMESVWATAHVHVGFDSRTKESLSYQFFQHVAFILLSYEPLITLCFPRRCSGISIPRHEIPEPPVNMDDNIPEDLYDEAATLTAAEQATQRASERAATRDSNDEMVKRLEEEYTGEDGVRSNYQYMQECLAPRLNKSPRQVMWYDMRNAIFEEEDNMVQLMRTMQHADKPAEPDGQRQRGYMVNWCNIYTIWTNLAGFKNPKPTLEFRQHPCTTSADVIKHWVLLLQAVMEVARQKVLEETKYGVSEPLDLNAIFAEREGSKYPNDGLPLGTVRQYVTQLLGLSESEGLYWENRYERYKNDRPP